MNIRERKSIGSGNFPEIYRDMIMYRQIEKFEGEPDPATVIIGVIECYLYYCSERKEHLKRYLTNLKFIDSQQYQIFDDVYRIVINIIDTGDINELDELPFKNENFGYFLDAIKDSIKNICRFDSLVPYNFLFQLSCIFEVSIRIAKYVESSNIKIIQYGNKEPIVDLFLSKENIWYIMYPSSIIKELELPRYFDKVYHCGCHNEHMPNCLDRRPYKLEEDSCSFYIIIGDDYK